MFFVFDWGTLYSQSLRPVMESIASATGHESQVFRLLSVFTSSLAQFAIDDED